MRNVLIIVLSLLTFGALVSVQPAAAKANCHTVCVWVYNDSNGNSKCTRTIQRCTGSDAQGSGKLQPIQQQKLRRQS
jgi:hypothetical protein